MIQDFTKEQLDAVVDMADEFRRVAIDRGFHDQEGEWVRGQWHVPLAIALIFTELSEALEEWRKNGESDHFVEELVDTFIRLLELAAYPSIGSQRFANWIDFKHRVNQSRPRRYGKRF